MHEATTTLGTKRSVCLLGQPGEYYSEEALFSSLRPTLLRVLRVPPLSLWEGNRLLGVAGRAPPGTCWPPMVTRLRMAARLLSPNLPELWRLGRWLHACEQRDLPEPHWHIGPIAVEIGRQGQGLGTRMMQALGMDLDRAGQLAFLETDKPENVRFYGKFGFEVVNEANVLGTRNWWMRRPTARRSSSTMDCTPRWIRRITRDYKASCCLSNE